MNTPKDTLPDDISLDKMRSDLLAILQKAAPSAPAAGTILHENGSSAPAADRDAPPQNDAPQH